MEFFLVFNAPMWIVIVKNAMKIKHAYNAKKDTFEIQLNKLVLNAWSIIAKYAKIQAHVLNVKVIYFNYKNEWIANAKMVIIFFKIYFLDLILKKYED